ncbi:J domain-containing protein [Pseudomonas sp. RIT623]|uniref:J domain-containing protein n=1 Tax=Pseudomonas sp. RIT623 TaxID=2559075 RepID=UPI00106FC039|nr:J domain-containing protein [Pseudomonas sp. RIT623]TFF35835.1 J domain-containing protein [Pseudomonas sp. RIT623]
MSHWQLLELSEDADARSIKRAYARLLKQHRPDDDPQAFQRLREAYESALAEAAWRAEDDQQVLAAPAPASPPSAQSTPPALPLEQIAPTLATSPPQPSLAQMQQWLADGQERQVIDALHLWLASEWLVALERREQFEQDLLAWLESAPQWSPAFFERVCQAMGWDATQGALPCAYWRWSGLIQRCEQHALEVAVRQNLDRFDADPELYRETALLLKPMSDRQRRSLADLFHDYDWQRFSELAQTLEYQHPELPARLDLQPLDNWRQWLPATSYFGVYAFLWFSLSLLLLATLVTHPNRLGSSALLLSPLFVAAVVFVGMKVYRIWTFLAVLLAPLDVPLSRWMLPPTWYRQSAGLLVLRHVLPSAAPAALAFVWCKEVPWLQWSSPLLMFVGTLYFTHLALSGGRVPLWDRLRAAIMRPLRRLPWHLLRRENVLICLAVIATGIWVFMRAKPGL